MGDWEIQPLISSPDCALYIHHTLMYIRVGQEFSLEASGSSQKAGAQRVTSGGSQPSVRDLRVKAVGARQDQQPTVQPMAVGQKVTCFLW